jgi:hypothetical protein
MINKFKLLTATALFSLLSACGGGGGGGGSATTTVASTNAFDVSSGYRRLNSTGFQKTFTVGGGCSGTLAITSAPATTSATFEGTNGVSSVSVGVTTLTNCTPASSSSTVIRYYDSNYVPLGKSSTDEYAVNIGTPTLPSSARVGDAGIAGSANTYTNKTKATLTGRNDSSYLIEADTATTAILNLITKTYNASGVLTSTEQDRYRVAADGTLTFISFDLQRSGTSTLRLTGN